MRHSRDHRSSALYITTLLVIAYVSSACPTIPNPDYILRTDCPGSIKFLDDTKVNPNGTYLVTKHSSSPFPTTFAWQPIVKKNDPTYTAALYTNHEFAPILDWSNPSWLTDAFFLQLPRVDNTNTRPKDFLKVKIPPGDAVGLWVAYDQRALSADHKKWNVPPWLTQEFETAGNLHIASTEHVKPLPGQSTAPHVYYGVWRLRNMAKRLSAGLTLEIGGNNAPGAVWLPNTGMGSQYLLLVVRKPKPGVSPTPRLLETVWALFTDGAQFTFNQADLDKALDDELKLNWLNEGDNRRKYQDAVKKGLITIEGKVCDCLNVTQGAGIQQMKSCPLTSGGPLINAGVIQSTGSFDPAWSTATMNVATQGSATVHLDGDIRFRVTETNQVEIGEVHLYGAPTTLSGSGKPLTQLSIGHDATFVASCAGSVPGEPFRLCDQYQVPAGGFPASGFVNIDGHDFAARLANSGPVAVSIDTNRTQFSIDTGQMYGSVSIGDDVYEVTTALHLEGPFLNLAPVARVAELAEYYECEDQGIAEVTLYSTSFDEAQPGDIVNTAWYENQCSSSETLLATGTSLTRNFGFGNHFVTLEVTDTRGVSHATDFVVKVRDSKIDVAEAPPDQWLLLQDRTGSDSCLGQYYASDICSGSVLVSKDAPDCDHYPPGMTVVEWTFDDQHGNLVVHEQRIFVADAATYPPPISSVTAAATELAPGQWLELTHATTTQGKAMIVDEYLLISTPSGDPASINGTGDIVLGAVEPHRTAWTVGGGNTSDVVYGGVFSNALSEPGEYRIESILVLAGGDPQDDTQVLASSSTHVFLEP